MGKKKAPLPAVEAMEAMDHIAEFQAHAAAYVGIYHHVVAALQKSGHLPADERRVPPSEVCDLIKSWSGK